ncbi:MAG: hypothetical protein WD535_03795 [Thermaerobacterales bacterium]
MPWLKGTDANADDPILQQTYLLKQKRFTNPGSTGVDSPLTLNPSLMRTTVEMSWVILYGKLFNTTREDDPPDAHQSSINRLHREMIATVVSADNSCAY